jgi:hypothetical protein
LFKIKNKFFKNSLPLLANYGVSLVGDTLYLFAINWFLVSQTKTTSLLGEINSISTLILLVSNIIVGPIVDTYNRKKLLIFSDLVSFFACLICSLLFRDYVDDKFILIITSSILSISMAINSPSAKAIVPYVISKENIERFNSIQNTLSSVIKVSTPIIGSIILAINNNFNFFIFINSLSFLISAILISTVTYSEVKDNMLNETFQEQFFSGLKYVAKKTEILGILIFISLLNFVMISYDLAIPYVINVLLKESDKIYSLVISVEAIGGIIGGLFLTYRSKKNSEDSFVQDISYLSLALLLAGIFNNIYLILLCSLINGFYLVQINAKVFTIIQKKTNQNYLGRVFALLFVFSSLFTPFSNFIFGKIIPILQWHTFTLCSISIFIISYLISKYFLR